MSLSTVEIPELELFFDEAWITDVIRTLRSGKEATAYCCAGGPTSGLELVAAKLYRPLQSRGFKNDAVYQAGRFDGADRRTRLAFEQKSRAGREVQFSTWVEHEYRTLERLYRAGADVPQPLTKSTDVILMAFIGDEEAAAPALNDVRLEAEEARAIFRRLLWNVELWLTHGRVHGDLSAYNILYWEGRAVVIDFPQAVDPEVNPNAYQLLTRDLANLCNHFRRYGVSADPARLADELWTRWKFGEAAALTRRPSRE